MAKVTQTSATEQTRTGPKTATTAMAEPAINTPACGAARQEKAPTAPEQCLLVYITAPSAEEAERIAHALVRERLAAGVNILSGARSCYWWQGEVQEKEECLLLAQSTCAAFPSLEARVRTLHSYEVPCIVAVPLAAGHQPFLDWTTAETAASFTPDTPSF